MTLEQATKQLESFMDGKILTFSVTFSEEDNNNWIAQCNEIDGIITCGSNNEMDYMYSQMQDAIITAAGIPNEHTEQLIKRLKKLWGVNEVTSTRPAVPFPTQYLFSLAH